MKKIFLAAAAACVMFSSAAQAEVTFDPATGTGFVGKGDIQAVYNWNNALLQENFSLLEFRFNAIATYDGECEFYTGPDRNRMRHTTEEEIVVGIAGAVVATGRQKNQITGVILDGFDGEPTSTGGTVPQVGAQCKFGEGNSESQWLSVEQISSSGGGLQVRFDGGDWMDLQ